jgi:hypothetical protein
MNIDESSINIDENYDPTYQAKMKIKNNKVKEISN